MKKFNINVVFLLLFFDTNFNAAAPPDMSSFTELVDHLSIVARVSNAIALQTELMRNNTNIKIIMRELIPGQDDFLPLIRRVNVTDATKVLSWLMEEVTKTKTYKEKMTEGELKEALQLYTYLARNTEMIKTLKQDNELTAQKFYDAVNDPNVLKTLNVCNREVLDLVSDFYRLEIFLRQEQRHNILNLFHNLSSDEHVSDIEKCFGSIKTLFNKFIREELFYSFISLNKIKRLKDIARIFEQKSTKFGLIGNISESVQKFMGKMKGIWSNLPLAFDSSDVDRLMLLYSEIWDYVNLGSAQKGITAGFILPMETIQVKEDLESSFFKNKIAGKRKVSGLTKALKFYLKFATEAAKLEKAFADSVHFIKDHMPKIERMNATVDVFLYFDPTNILKNLADLTKDAYECSQKVQPVLVKNSFADFEEANNHLTNILERFQRMQTVTTTAEKKVVPEKLVQMLKDFKMAESTLDEETIEGWLGAYRERVDYHLIRDGAKLLFDFNEVVNSLENDIKDLRNSSHNVNSFSVKKQIESSSLFPVLECYNNKRFKFNIIKNSVKFLINVVSFSDDEMINATSSFFEHLRKIQEAQENVYRVMENEKADVPESRVLLDFSHPLDLSQRFGKGVKVLRDIRDVIKEQNVLQDLKDISYASKVLIGQDSLKGVQYFHNKLDQYIRRFQNNLHFLEQKSNLSANTNLSNTKPVFHAAMKVIGFNISKDQLTAAAKLLQNAEEIEDSRRFVRLSQLNLDFVRFRNILNGAATSAIFLHEQFDYFFGIRTEKSKLVIVQELSAVALLLIILTFIGVFVLLVLAGLVGYGLTKSGRAKYKNYWLYYFGKPEDFEKRWRYSLFMDTVEGNNVVVDCAREVNPVNLKKVLSRGAYVNVYSNFGNTALHTATKRGFPEIVKILITHGADRSLINYQNKTAEQMLPREKDYAKMEVKVASRYRATAQVYEKLRVKKYRARLPQEFPVFSYHIYMENRTNDELTDNFMDKFQYITSDEALPTTTHCVCHTTADGVLETNNFEVLQWIFRGVIMVKEQWMTDCLQNPELIERDEDYLIHHVKYNGVMYQNAILPWSQAMAKGAMPYLQGVYMVVVMHECPYFLSLASVIPKLGAVLLPSMPSREIFNKGAHPYLHVHKNPVWILHDSTFDLSAYQNDPDHLYHVISEQEFVALLLKREIDQDMSTEPVPVVNVQEDFI
uniref:BRCT domain-containing protein n=1 Tax=Caenorhabditis japonica TaxID=281687 RepID=A0A8R1HKT1_CAEJA